MPRFSPFVEALGPEPHEGGYCCELWRSEVLFVAADASRRAESGPRESASICIYFFLHSGDRSAWHLVASAGLWLYHPGSPLPLTFGGDGDASDPQGELELGPDVMAGQRP